MKKPRQIHTTGLTSYWHSVMIFTMEKAKTNIYNRPKQLLVQLSIFKNRQTKLDKYDWYDEAAAPALQFLELVKQKHIRITSLTNC